MKLAQITNPAIGNLSTANATEATGSLLSTAIAILFVGGAILFFFLLATGAIMWMTSGGDKAKYEAAKMRITQAAVGLLILFLVFVIVNVVGCIFGVNLLEFEIGELNIGFGASPVCGGSSSGGGGGGGGGGAPGPPPIPL